MSTIVARAAVPAHARLSDADTVQLSPVPCAMPAADTIIDVVTDPALSPVEKMARLSPGVPFEGAAAELAVEHLTAAVGLTTAPVIVHPDWEVACLPGDTPLHLSREWAVTVPANFRDKTTEVSAQVQSGDDGPAEVYLQGSNDIALSPEHAEEFAAAILAAAALARRVNADRITGAEGGAAA